MAMPLLHPELSSAQKRRRSSLSSDSSSSVSELISGRNSQDGPPGEQPLTASQSPYRRVSKRSRFTGLATLSAVAPGMPQISVTQLPPGSSGHTSTSAGIVNMPIGIAPLVDTEVCQDAQIWSCFTEYAIHGLISGPRMASDPSITVYNPTPKSSNQLDWNPMHHRSHQQQVCHNLTIRCVSLSFSYLR
jgi:hypothetical protein